jgi:peroxiredoxin Q/BCP
MTLSVGDKAPSFTAPTDGGQTLSLDNFKGKNVVLYFYPKDDTPGCTTEACDFRDNLTALQGLNAVVIGVSKDDAKAHDKFKKKYDLNFPLVVDDSGICEAYGCWVEKSMYGKTYMGIERSTFLIDGNGVIKQVWRKVSVKGHVDEVKAALAA